MAEFESLLSGSDQPPPVKHETIEGVWSCTGAGTFECRKDAKWNTLMIVKGYMKGTAVYSGGIGLYSADTQSLVMTSNDAIEERNLNHVLVHKWKRVAK